MARKTKRLIIWVLALSGPLWLASCAPHGAKPKSIKTAHQTHAPSPKAPTGDHSVASGPGQQTSGISLTNGDEPSSGSVEDGEQIGSQAKISGPTETYFVVMYGKVEKDSVKAEQKKLQQINVYPQYEATHQATEDKVSWAPKQLYVIDRSIVRTSQHAIKSFAHDAENVTGLSVFYRPIDQVQASVNLDVLNMDGEIIHTFPLGDAMNAIPIEEANLADPGSYLFSRGAGEAACRFVDAGCLSYLKDRGFLDDHLQFSFWKGGVVQRRSASIRDILAYLFQRSSAVLQKSSVIGPATSTAPAPSTAADFVGASGDMMGNAIQIGDVEPANTEHVIGKLVLRIGTIQASEEKNPMGSLPVRSWMVEPSDSEHPATSAFVHETPTRFLYDLPVAAIQPIVSPPASAKSTFSLKKFYHAMEDALR